MRPIGSWFFGRYADRNGRKAALTLSVTMMSAGSFAIAMLPTKDVIGVWALILLVFIRLIQGFSVGGEYGTSATYMSEAATAKRRGFFSSFQYVTLIGGQMLALLSLVILERTLARKPSVNGAGVFRSPSAASQPSWSCGSAAPWRRPSPQSRPRLPTSGWRARPSPAP